MRTFRVQVPVASTSLFDLIGQEVDICKSVLLQTPMANTANVFFGENGREFAYIVNGGSAGIDITNIRGLYVKGNGTDYLIVVTC